MEQQELQQIQDTINKLKIRVFDAEEELSNVK